MGGAGAYQFLNVPINARASGLGGKYVSIQDEDINSFLQNPASLNKEMNQGISVNYLPFFSDIKATSLVYGLPFKENKTIGMGFTFFDYGKMTQTEADGTVTGTFRVNEFALTGGISHSLGNYSIGANLKFAGASLASYSSYAILTDIGGFFNHPEKDWTVGMVFKNLGFAIKNFSQGTGTRMPLEILIGTSYKLENLPFRFTLTAHNIQKPDIVYLDPNKSAQKDLEGNEIKENKSIADQVFRHFIIGGELLLSKNLHIRFAYNPQRRKELRLEETSGGAGFSIGGVLKVKRIGFAYTRAFYHPAGASNHLTVTTNLNNFWKKGELPN